MKWLQIKKIQKIKKYSDEWIDLLQIESNQWKNKVKLNHPMNMGEIKNSNTFL